MGEPPLGHFERAEISLDGSGGVAGSLLQVGQISVQPYQRVTGVGIARPRSLQVLRDFETPEGSFPCSVGSAKRAQQIAGPLVRLGQQLLIPRGALSRRELLFDRQRFPVTLQLS